MAMEWKVAFPLHPEYRTLPMVWYVPPLSPIQSAAAAGKIGIDGEMPDVRSLRIPLKYLANLLTAGNEAPVALALERMLAMRAYMRAKTIDGVIDEASPERVGLTAAQIEDMYQIMAIANYEDRFVIPTAHREVAEDAYDLRGSCGFSFGNGCSGGTPKPSLFGDAEAARQDADGGRVMAQDLQGALGAADLSDDELQAAAGEIARRASTRERLLPRDARAPRCDPLIDEIARRRSLRPAGALCRSCSTARARCRCISSSMCTARAATAARRWSICGASTRRRAWPRRDRAAGFPAAVPRIPLDASDRRRRARCSARPPMSSPRSAERLDKRGSPYAAVFARWLRSPRPSADARAGRRCCAEPDADPDDLAALEPPGRRRGDLRSRPPTAELQGPTLGRAASARRQSGPRRRRAPHIEENAMAIPQSRSVRLVSLSLPDRLPGRQLIRFDREQYTWRTGSSQLLRRKPADVGLEPVPRRHSGHLRSAISSAC